MCIFSMRIRSDILSILCYITVQIDSIKTDLNLREMQFTQFFLQIGIHFLLLVFCYIGRKLINGKRSSIGNCFKRSLFITNQSIF